MFPDLISGEIRCNAKIHPFEHQLDVSGSPIAFRPRRLNPEKAKEPNSQIDELLRLHIFRSSTSPWASPVHLVKKKDDSLRLLTDYRAINQKTAKINYPLPRLQDFTAYVNSCAVFSCLDLKSAFWQLDVLTSIRFVTCIPFSLVVFILSLSFFVLRKRKRNKLPTTTTMSELLTANIQPSVRTEVILNSTKCLLA